jgi:hypothetical protein
MRLAQERHAVPSTPTDRRKPQTGERRCVSQGIRRGEMGQ